MVKDPGKQDKVHLTLKKQRWRWSYGHVQFSIFLFKIHCYNVCHLKSLLKFLMCALWTFVHSFNAFMCNNVSDPTFLTFFHFCVWTRRFSCSSLILLFLDHCFLLISFPSSCWVFQFQFLSILFISRFWCVFMYQVSHVFFPGGFSCRAACGKRLGDLKTACTVVSNRRLIQNKRKGKEGSHIMSSLMYDIVCSNQSV